MVVFTGICALIVLLCSAIAVVTLFVIAVRLAVDSFRDSETGEGLFALLIAVAIVAVVGSLCGGAVLQLRKDNESHVEEKP